MIVLRVDSSNSIGTGHVTRCVRLAELLVSLGHEIIFLCLDLPGNICSLIEKKNYAIQKFSNENSADRWLGALKPDWIIVDHYGLDTKWEKQFSESSKIFVIDDLGRNHSCQVLLDQNYRRNYTLYDDRVPTDCRLLLGPAFCLLEQNIVQLQTKKTFNSPAKVTCFFGGIDSSGELVKLAQNIKYNPSFRYDLVCLSSHLHLDSLNKISLPENAKLFVNRTDWLQLLASSDFYIGSGGTVTWERMYAGLPGAVITVADNQVNSARDLALDGYQFYWGPSYDFKYEYIDDHLTKIFASPEIIVEMSEKGKRLVSKFDSDLAESIFGRKKQ